MIVLSQIFCRVCRWKNYENPLKIDKVIELALCASFLEHSVQYLNVYCDSMIYYTTCFRGGQRYGNAIVTCAFFHVVFFKLLLLFVISQLYHLWWIKIFIIGFKSVTAAFVCSVQCDCEKARNAKRTERKVAYRERTTWTELNWTELALHTRRTELKWN